MNRREAFRALLGAPVAMGAVVASAAAGPNPVAAAAGETIFNRVQIKKLDVASLAIQLDMEPIRAEIDAHLREMARNLPGIIRGYRKRGVICWFGLKPGPSNDPSPPVISDHNACTSACILWKSPPGCMAKWNGIPSNVSIRITGASSIEPT